MSSSSSKKRRLPAALAKNAAAAAAEKRAEVLAAGRDDVALVRGIGAPFAGPSDPFTPAVSLDAPAAPTTTLQDFVQGYHLISGIGTLALLSGGKQTAQAADYFGLLSSFTGNSLSILGGASGVQGYAAQLGVASSGVGAVLTVAGAGKAAQIVGLGSGLAGAGLGLAGALGSAHTPLMEDNGGGVIDYGSQTDEGVTGDASSPTGQASTAANTSVTPAPDGGGVIDYASQTAEGVTADASPPTGPASTATSTAVAPAPDGGSLDDDWSSFVVGLGNAAVLGDLDSASGGGYDILTNMDGDGSPDGQAVAGFASGNVFAGLPTGNVGFGASAAVGASDVDSGSVPDLAGPISEGDLPGSLVYAQPEAPAAPSTVEGSETPLSGA